MSASVLLSKTLEAIETRMALNRAAGSTAADSQTPVAWMVGERSPPVLRRGCVHEWLGIAPFAEERNTERPAPRGSLRDWQPAIALSTHVAISALRTGRDDAGVAVWIGRRCWPYPHQLARVGTALLMRSVFVDPPDTGSRLWAIDLALRSPAVSVVIADGSGLDMAASRRLQLAAEAGAHAADRAGSGGIAGGLGLLLRPWWEMASISAAWTRWLVRREASEGRWPRWRIELLRNRAAAGAIGMGMRGLDHAATNGGETMNTWTVEWDRADAGLVVPAGMGGGTGETARAACGDAVEPSRRIA